MNLERGFSLWHQQFKALLWKNKLLSWWNKRSSFMQLFASFFVFLIFAVHKANEAQVSSSTAYRKVMDPRPLVSPPIPRCEDKFYAKTPCFDFVWSGNGSVRIWRIVRSIMANNPGRPIPSSKVPRNSQDKLCTLLNVREVRSKSHKNVFVNTKVFN